MLLLQSSVCQSALTDLCAGMPKAYQASDRQQVAMLRWGVTQQQMLEPSLPPQRPGLTLQSMAVRPFMLDSALSFVQPPSLDHRVQKEEAKSTFSRIFTWGGKK